MCQESLRLRRWTGEPWVIGLFIKMARKYGYLKMKNIEKTNILPLRWIGNIFGEFASSHLLKAVYMDEDGDFNWRYTYHAKMWKILDKPYQWWGTYYFLDRREW